MSWQKMLDHYLRCHFCFSKLKMMSKFAAKYLFESHEFRPWSKIFDFSFSYTKKVVAYCVVVHFF